MDPSTDQTKRSPIRDLTGQVIDGKYRVLKPIASGGFGIVYEVRRILLDEEQTDRLALKTIRPDLRDREDTIGRFRDEVLITHKLKTEFVCSVPDAGVIDNGELYYMVMEFAEGGSLEDHLRGLWEQDRQASIERVEQWFRECLLAMVEAERIGIVHRDLKPQNILLTAEGQIRVADFGIARRTDPDPQRKNLTGEHHWVGDRMWASPEQMMGEVSHRSDMYSLGATLHYALTREHPVRTRACRPSARRKDVPQWMDLAIARMTEPVPEERFETFAEALETLPEPPKPNPGLWKWITAGTIALAVLAGLAIWQFWPDAGSLTWEGLREQGQATERAADELDVELASLTNVQSLTEKYRAWDGAFRTHLQAVGDRGKNQPGELLAPNDLTEASQSLDQGLAELRDDIEAVSSALAKLAEIQASLATRSTQKSTAELEALRESRAGSRAISRFAEVRDINRALGRTIDALETSRSEELESLRARFSTATRLDELSAEARRLETENRNRDETELADEAALLAGTARRALSIAEMPLPTQATPADPMSGMRAFESTWFEELDKRRETAETEGDGWDRALVLDWWSRRERLIREAAGQRLTECLSNLDSALAPRVEASNAVVRRGFDETQQTEYDAIRSTLNEAQRLALTWPTWLGVQKAAVLSAIRELTPIAPGQVYGPKIDAFKAQLERFGTCTRQPDRDYGTLFDKLDELVRAARADLAEMEEFAASTEPNQRDPNTKSTSCDNLRTALDRIAIVDVGYGTYALALRTLEDGEPAQALGLLGGLATARGFSPALDDAASKLEARCKRAMEQAANRPTQTQPDGTSDAAWATWKERAEEFDYPEGLKYDAATDTWFFPWRQLLIRSETPSRREPVRMRLVVDDAGGETRRAWLVDVHQVVDGEIDLFRAVRNELRFAQNERRNLFAAALEAGADLDKNTHRCRTVGSDLVTAKAAATHWNKLAGDNDAPQQFTIVDQGLFALLTQRWNVNPPQPRVPDATRDADPDVPDGGFEDLGTGLTELLSDAEYPSGENFRLHGMRAVFKLTLF